MRRAKDVRRLVIEKRREHSRKPDCIRERIERLVSGPYLELFARETKPGWNCCGNQAGLFDSGSVARTKTYPMSCSLISASGAAGLRVGGSAVALDLRLAFGRNVALPLSVSGPGRVSRESAAECAMIPYLTLFVDLVKGIAWPVLVFCVVYMFRQPLKALLPRVRRAGPTGIVLSEVQSELVSKWTGELKQLPGLQRTAAIEIVEKAIHTELDLARADDRIDLLVNRLAQNRLAAIFERVYGAIYGSQIAGLRALVNAGGKVTMAEAVQFFDQLKSKKPDLSEANFGRG
jgi:hypothetical protein